MRGTLARAVAESTSDAVVDAHSSPDAGPVEKAFAGAPGLRP
jgi:hypothetical protein